MLTPPILGILPVVLPAVEFDQLYPDIWVWHRLDPSIKADLFSTALAGPEGLFLVDPISIPESQLRHLIEARPMAGIVVTNANHHRSAVEYSDRFSVPIFAHKRTLGDQKPSRLIELKAEMMIGSDIEVIEIEGAADGEIALYHASNGGTLVLGDALINFEPYGFAFLPGKYCLNQRQMQRSLRQLLSKSAERLLFAHGTPIMSDASGRLRQLLDASSR